MCANDVPSLFVVASSHVGTMCFAAALVPTASSQENERVPDDVLKAGLHKDPHVTLVGHTTGSSPPVPTCFFRLFANVTLFEMVSCRMIENGKFTC